MGALWSGTKLADIFGSMMLLSREGVGKIVKKEKFSAQTRIRWQKKLSAYSC